MQFRTFIPNQITNSSTSLPFGIQSSLLAAPGEIGGSELEEDDESLPPPTPPALATIFFFELLALSTLPGLSGST